MEPMDLCALAKRVHDAEGYRLGAESTREERNAFWARVVGIAHHGHAAYNLTPDPRWHLKNGGPGRPQSDDVAVIMPERLGMDFITGVGATGYQFQLGHAFTLPPDQEVWKPPVPSGGAVAPAPVVSLWSAAHTAELAKLGRPAGELDAAFTLKVAQHFAAVFPSEGWGQKRASSGRPVSGDVVARRDGARLLGYKVVPVPAAAPAQMDITGQVFEAVVAQRHADAEPAPVEPVDPKEPLPPAEFFEELFGSLRVDMLASLMAADAARGAAVEAREASRDTKKLAEGLKGQKFEVKGLPRYFGTPTIEPKAGG